MANELKQQIKGVARSLAELQDRIGGLNDSLEAAREHRHTVAIAPPTRQETAAKLTALVDHRANRYAYKFRDLVFGTFRTQLDPSKSDPLPGTHDFFSRRTFEGNSIDPDALCYFFCDLIKQRITDEVGSMAWPGGGLAAAEREAALAKLDSEIERLEGQKAELFEELRAAGVHVSERDVLMAPPDDVKIIRPSPPPTVGTAAEPRGGQPPSELDQVAADLRGDHE